MVSSNSSPNLNVILVVFTVEWVSIVQTSPLMLIIIVGVVALANLRRAKPTPKSNKSRNLSQKTILQRTAQNLAPKPK